MRTPTLWMRIIVPLAAGVLAPAASGQSDEVKRLDRAAVVFEEIMSIGDQSIPQDLLQKSHCAVIVPGLKKGAFIVGAKFGRGFFTCRTKGGGWSAPAAIRVEGGSVGFQIGGSETDVFMLVMNERGAGRLVSSKFTLGGDASVAAGPVGRTATAETDAYLSAEILSWNRSRGVFAGISLQGATLRQDLDANKSLYGRQVENKELVTGNVQPPAAADRLLKLLAKYPPQK